MTDLTKLIVFDGEVHSNEYGDSYALIWKKPNGDIFAIEPYSDDLLTGNRHFYNRIAGEELADILADPDTRVYVN